LHSMVQRISTPSEFYSQADAERAFSQATAAWSFVSEVAA
jgi:hypothetical protein